MRKLDSSKVRTSDLVFYSKSGRSWTRVPWAREDPSFVWAGIFLHAPAKDVQKTIPSIAFRILPPGGKVMVWAKAYVPGEHSEVVEWAKANQIPYLEQTVMHRREVSGFLRRVKEEVKIPALITIHQRIDTLEKVFELYDSWLIGYGDLFLLGVDGSTDISKSHFQALSMAGGQIPRELMEASIYLMVTAEEHGAYLLSQKISRGEIEKVCRGVLSEHGWQLAVKES